MERTWPSSLSMKYLSLQFFMCSPEEDNRDKLSIDSYLEIDSIQDDAFNEDQWRDWFGRNHHSQSINFHRLEEFAFLWNPHQQPCHQHQRHPQHPHDQQHHQHHDLTSLEELALLDNRRTSPTPTGASSSFSHLGQSQSFNFSTSLALSRSLTISDNPNLNFSTSLALSISTCQLHRPSQSLLLSFSPRLSSNFSLSSHTPSQTLHLSFFPRYFFQS